MSEAFDTSNASASARCLYCGTVQEPPCAEGVDARCVKCLHPWKPTANLAASTTPTPKSQPPRRPEMNLERSRVALRELLDQGLRLDAPLILEEVIAADKRLNKLVAFVPFVGPWLIFRGEGYDEAEQRRLGYVSIAMTCAIVLLAVALFPRLGLRDADLRERIEADIRVLGALAEQYRAEHAAYPDVAAWQRTAELPDRRFFDPWHRPYRYEPSAGAVTISTLGQDGTTGGAGDDADVSLTFPEPAASH